MAGTIRISSPEKIGVPGASDSSGASFVGAIAAGHLTLAGKATSVIRSLPIACGHLNVTGKGLAILSEGWQFVTITSLVSVHVVATLYDALDPAYGLTPAIGDEFRTPRFSTDGGTINLSVDGRFEIGAPTSGFDSIPNVEYFSILTGLWYGPVTLTVIDPLLTLTIARGHMIWDGKEMLMERRRFILPGHLVTFGHIHRIDRTRVIQAGHLTLAGKVVGKLRSLIPALGHLTIEGKTVTLNATLTLQFDAGHLTLEGKAATITRSLPVEAGHLTVTGRDVTMPLGVPYFVTPGHLAITGATMRLRRYYIIQPGHLVFHGKSVFARSTGAVSGIDKPGVRTRGKRRNMVSSQVD